MPTTDELQAQINALQQQLNQIIGMSNDDYVLTYSGEEVDDLLGNASAAVRYDLAQSLTAAQQAQARSNINAAPDGFGYGGALDTVSGSTDEAFLAAVEAKLAAMPYMGAMQINWGSYPALDGLARVGTLAKHNGGQYASIKGYSYGGTAITRCKNAGTWGPWEWVNPPLALGVEYRTTERYLGKPVYVKVVDCGHFAAAGTVKEIMISDDNAEHMVGCTGRVREWQIPATLFAGNPADAGDVRLEGRVDDLHHFYIYLYSKEFDLTAWQAIVTIKYTKTTD